MEDYSKNNCVKYLDTLFSKFCEENNFIFIEDDPDDYDVFVPYKSISITPIEKYRFSILNYIDEEIPILEFCTYEKNYYGAIDIYNEITEWILEEFIAFEIYNIENELKEFEKSIEKYNLEISKITLLHSESFKYSLPVDIAVKLF